MQLRFRKKESERVASINTATVESIEAASSNALSEHEHIGGANSRIVIRDRYLDEVIGRLGNLPNDVLTEIGSELSAHLESLIVAHQELGANREAATIAAIRQFGEPKAIAKRFRRAWHSTSHESAWPATRFALRYFGTAAFAFVTISALIPVLSPGASVTDSVTFWAAMLAIPALIGRRIGSLSPGRGALGSFYALSLFTLAALPICDWGTDNGTASAGAYHRFHELIGNSAAGASPLWQFAMVLMFTCIFWPTIGSAAALLAAASSTFREDLRRQRA